MSFIDLFAEGQHSSMHVQLTSSVHETELFISKYSSQRLEFCGEHSICGHVPSRKGMICLNR